jgi:hypothetical protein
MDELGLEYHLEYTEEALQGYACSCYPGNPECILRLRGFRRLPVRRSSVQALRNARFVEAIALHAQDNRADPVLAEAMEDTTVTLQQGVTAAASVGRPISAKFEIEDGRLQLSIYT